MFTNLPIFDSASKFFIRNTKNSNTFQRTYIYLLAPCKGKFAIPFILKMFSAEPSERINLFNFLTPAAHGDILYDFVFVICVMIIVDLLRRFVTLLLVRRE